MDIKNELIDIRYRGFTATVQPVNDWEQVYACVEGVSPKLEVYAPDIVVLKIEFKKMIDKYLDELYIDKADVKIKHTFMIEVSENYLGILSYLADNFGISMEELVCDAFDGYIEDGLGVIDEENAEIEFGEAEDD